MSLLRRATKDWNTLDEESVRELEKALSQSPAPSSAPSGLGVAASASALGPYNRVPPPPLPSSFAGANGSSVNIPIGPKWPQHVHNHDSQEASYINDMTDAVVALQALVSSLEDKSKAMQERIELLEDDFAGR